MILHGKADGRQQVDRDSFTAIREVIDPHNFADVVSIDRAEGVGIGEGDKKPQMFLVASVVSSEIASATAGIHGGEHLVEFLDRWLRWSRAHQARKLDTGPMTLFRLCRYGHELFQLLIPYPLRTGASVSNCTKLHGSQACVADLSSKD